MSHRPLNLETLIARRFSTPRTDRMNESRLRARSFEASQTTHSGSLKTDAADHFSTLQAWSRCTSASVSGGRIALQLLLVIVLYSFRAFVPLRSSWRGARLQHKSHANGNERALRGFSRWDGPIAIKQWLLDVSFVRARVIGQELLQVRWINLLIES